MSIQAVNNGGLITTPELQGQEQPAQGLTKRAGPGGERGGSTRLPHTEQTPRPALWCPAFPGPSPHEFSLEGCFSRLTRLFYPTLHTLLPHFQSHIPGFFPTCPRAQSPLDV